MLTVYVETWATYVAAIARIRTDGLTMTNGLWPHQRAPVCVGGQHRCWPVAGLRQ